MRVVEIENVTKAFDGHVAVDQLSLNVPKGSIYGFIGPNGSGKTTTLRMIMRIYLPDSGTVRVLGESSIGAANDRVGYLPEERGLYKKMKIKDVIEFHWELKGGKPNRREIQDWLDRMGLGDRAGDRVETLSKGMAQKVQFITTVVSKPDLVLLDEPFSGLDPVNVEVLRDAVLELKTNGSTVIFSTHEMHVAERMCDYIFMIYKGKKVLDGTLAEIQDSYGDDTIHVRLEDENEDSRGSAMRGISGVVGVTDFGKYQELRLARGADPQDVLAALMERGRLRSFELARPSLNDIFVRIAGDEARDHAKEPAHA